MLVGTLRESPLSLEILQEDIVCLPQTVWGGCGSQGCRTRSATMKGDGPKSNRHKAEPTVEKLCYFELLNCDPSTWA